MKIIETERLILREWRKEDLGPFSEINKDPIVMEYMLRCLTEAETESFYARIQEHFEKYGYGLFACELKATGDFIGFVGLYYLTFESAFTPCVEIGWRLSSDHWGKGYATEGAKAVLKAAFEEYGLKEIVSCTAESNFRSRKVMEKIGMKQDLKGNFYHPSVPKGNPLSLHVLYRITKEDYRNLIMHQ